MFNGTYQTFPAFLLAVISEVINGDNATDAPDAYDTSPNNPARFWSHNADGRSQAHSDLHAEWVGRVEADFDATHGTDQAASDTAAAAHVTLGEAAQGTVAQARASKQNFSTPVKQGTAYHKCTSMPSCSTPSKRQIRNSPMHS